MVRYLAKWVLILFGPVEALAGKVTIATWNLGWRMDQQTVLGQ